MSSSQILKKWILHTLTRDTTRISKNIIEPILLRKVSDGDQEYSRRLLTAVVLRTSGFCEIRANSDFWLCLRFQQSTVDILVKFKSHKRQKTWPMEDQSPLECQNTWKIMQTCKSLSKSSSPRKTAKQWRNESSRMKHMHTSAAVAWIIRHFLSWIDKCLPRTASRRSLREIPESTLIEQFSHQVVETQQARGVSPI